MNKGQLVETIAKKTGQKKCVVESVIDSFIMTTRSRVIKGDEVKLMGLGTFTKLKRKARNGHNPQTMKKMKIKAFWVPKFKAHDSFRDLVK